MMKLKEEISNSDENARTLLFNFKQGIKCRRV